MEATLTTSAARPVPASILCVDWGKDPGKRAVAVADVSSRTIWKPDWPEIDLRTLLARAAELPAPRIIAIDASLGVPEVYFAKALELADWSAAKSFLEWLPKAAASPRFFETCMQAAQWSVNRPFFSVPAGAGGLDGFRTAAGGDLLRSIERESGAKSTFIVSGIPGSVGSGTRVLWMQLAPLLRSERSFSVWPFEGPLQGLLDAGGSVLCEIYPRLAYGIALAGSLPTRMLALGKTDPDVRRSALNRLRSSRWFAESGIAIRDDVPAHESEDDFDALLTAVALLRCALDSRRFCDLVERRDAPHREGVRRAEGGILGEGALERSHGAQTFLPFATLRGSVKEPSTRPITWPARPQAATGVLECPLGCGKVFRGSRGGWDAHVASRSRHPGWHPDVLDPEQRKHLFRREFSSWFGAPFGDSR